MRRRTRFALLAAGYLLLTSAVGLGAGRVASATRKLMFGGAVRSTQRAAKGVAGVGTTVLEGVAKLAERASTAARGVTHLAARPTTAVLRETLRFWEAVESAVGAGSDEKGEERPREEPAPNHS